MMKHLILFLFLFPALLFAQENPLNIFRPLENYVWSAEGNWGDGSVFKQEITLKYSLDGKIVLVESRGFVNERNDFGLRNHGVRQFDETSGKIRFWEFDIFGSVTEGSVLGTGRDIMYQYQYGDSFLTEMWVYKSETSYDFVVGVYEDGEWEQKYLETEFIGKPDAN